MILGAILASSGCIGSAARNFGEETGLHVEIVTEPENQVWWQVLNTTAECERSDAQRTLQKYQAPHGCTVQLGSVLDTPAHTAGIDFVVVPARGPVKVYFAPIGDAQPISEGYHRTAMVEWNLADGPLHRNLTLPAGKYGLVMWCGEPPCDANLTLTVRRYEAVWDEPGNK